MNALQALIDTHWTPLPTLAKRGFAFLAAAVVVLAVVVGTTGSNSGTVGAGDWLTQASATPAPTDAISLSGTSQVSAKVVVQVVGLVTKPGVYELSQGERVIDAIFRAGGFADGADQASVNLARALNDGEQINVLPLDNSAVVDAGQSSAAGAKTVNLNLADAASLDALPGIGPTLAQRIVDYRSANGGFRSLSDLAKVAGIGPSLLAKLKDAVTL